MGARPVEQVAGIMQAAGAVGLAVGLFVILPWGLALAIVGALALAGGTALEIGARPRQVAAPPRPLTVEERRAASLADLATHQSGR